MGAALARGRGNSLPWPALRLPPPIQPSFPSPYLLILNLQHNNTSFAEKKKLRKKRTGPRKHKCFCVGPGSQQNTAYIIIHKKETVHCANDYNFSSTGSTSEPLTPLFDV